MTNLVSIAPAALGELIPLYALLDADGVVLDAGPTLRKTIPADELIGANVYNLFRFKHQVEGAPAEKLASQAGKNLRLKMINAPGTAFKGTLVPRIEGGYVLNLSFGIGVIQAVGEYELTSSDFSPTDLTIEMLYLNEAKSAVLSESRQLIKRLQGAKIAAEEKAFSDTLTGLRNRRAMDYTVNRFLEAKEPFGLMHLDLDFFKEVNDTMGHAAGDHVLQQVARILVSETRSEDTVARVGGDEFVLILKGLIDYERMRQIGERIISILERPICFNDVELNISASIGATVSTLYPDPQLEFMMKDADVALYASKAAGRACFTPYLPADPDQLHA